MKRTTQSRKKIVVPNFVWVSLISIAALSLIFGFVIPISIDAYDNRQYVKRNRTVVFNIFPPKEVEAVLSSVIDEEGKVIRNEERIIIEYNKVKSIKFQGSTLVIGFTWSDNIYLPNVTLAEWKAIEAEFDSK